MADWDRIWINANLATMAGTGAPYGRIENAAIATGGDRIVWAGTMDALPGKPDTLADEVVDVAGKWITPGLIDCHTHLVFGGTRAAEWEQRLGGASYEEIARAGGGILSTVRATRSAPLEDLVGGARRRLEHMIDFGTTTIEIKSGYGLDLATELRMLEAARMLADSGITVSTTLLGAHALAPEFVEDRAGYVDLVCNEMIPNVAERGLADAVDAFCEGIGFTSEECERVLRVGGDHGLAGRLHADQLSDLDGAALAARMGARSADHLEYTSESGARAMGEAGCAAVLLPGAFYFLGETRKPPVDAFRAHGAPLVVATDANPGSSPTTQPRIALNQACVLFGLTPAEALAGMTRLAAPVLGFTDRGKIEVGLRADLACWRIENPAELSYWMGGSPAQAVFSAGRRLR